MQQLNLVMELCGADEGTLGKIPNVLQVYTDITDTQPQTRQTVSSLSFLSCKMYLWTQHTWAHFRTWDRGKSSCVVHLIGQTRKKNYQMQGQDGLIPAPIDLWAIVLCEAQVGVLTLKEGITSMMLLHAESAGRYPWARQREEEGSTHGTPPEIWAFCPHFL